MRVRERQLLRVTADPFDRAFIFDFGAAPALAQHGGIDVAHGDRGFAAPCGAFGFSGHFRDAECDIAGAAGDIQHPPARLGIEPFHHRILPDAVNPARHDIVHQVIARRDRGKDLAHKAFLFGLRHVAETEAGGFAVVHVPSIARPWPDGLDKPMPELPEVETVRLGLMPALEGRTIKEALVRRKDLRLPFPPRFAERLTGRLVRKLTRRAKYILAELDSGETLVIHLGMSGRMSVYAGGHRRKLGDYVYSPAPDGAGQGKHDHVVLETDAPARIVFNDHRRFGLMTLIPTEDLGTDKLFKGIGVEPLSDTFTAKYLAAALDGKRTPV